MAQAAWCPVDTRVVRLTAAEIVAALEQEKREHERISARSDALAKTTRPPGEGSLLIGVTTRVWSYTSSPNPFFTAMLVGMRERASASGCHIVLLGAADDDDPQAYVCCCREHGIGGVVYHGVDPDDPGAGHVRALLDAGIPCVSVDAGGFGVALGHVSSDNVSAASDAVRHLYSLGRRRIATIAGPPEALAASERLLGYRTGLEQVGLPFREEYVAQGDYFYESGLTAACVLLALAEPPDAIFAAADVMAIAAIKVIQESGLRVPEDIAVVGFDDIEYAALLSPQLTTMRQDCGGLGAAAVEALLRMLTRPDKTPQEVVLPVELVVRESCGARTPMATAS